MKALQRIQNLFRKMAGRLPKEDTTRWREKPRYGVIVETNCQHEGKNCHRIRLAPGKEFHLPVDGFHTLPAAPSPPEVGVVVEVGDEAGWPGGFPGDPRANHTATREVQKLPHDQIGFLFSVLVEVRPEYAEHWLPWMTKKDFPNLDKDKLQKLLASSNARTRELALRLSSRAQNSRETR